MCVYICVKLAYLLLLVKRIVKGEMEIEFMRNEGILFFICAFDVLQTIHLWLYNCLNFLCTMVQIATRDCVCRRRIYEPTVQRTRYRLEFLALN